VSPQLSRKALPGRIRAARRVAARMGRRLWRRAVPTLRGAGSRPVEAWRRSLQLRVVATTLVVSSIVVVALGIVLLQQISDGLVEAKRGQAIDEAYQGQRYAQQQLQGAGPGDPDLVDTLRNVVATLSARGAGAGRFAVAIRADTTRNIHLSPLYVSRGKPDEVQVPPRLAAMVTERNLLAYQFVSTSIESGPEKPFIVVGAPVDRPAGAFQLYYFFPLDDEVATVALVQKSLIAIGALLLFLLAAIVALVTRQVVTPVRLAARTAERLSAGLLEERMTVRGQDDLARLAHSFNQMAGNLQRQIVQLEDLSRLQRRFTSDVSHELRTPLTTVRMAADVLHASRAEFEPSVARSAELLQTEVDRFESLLTDLLEISRYDGGFAVLEPEVTDVRTVVRHVLLALKPLAERAGTHLETELPDEPVVAEFDARRVERILRNLVGNAVEHGEGKPVRVTLAQDHDAVAVTVRDHGVGLRPGEAQVVFNRFWRADPSRARQTGGTGLGLSISLEDARLHGGWLQAWGEPGQGAQFRLTLPVNVRARLTSSPLPLEPPDRDAGVFHDHFDGSTDADVAGPAEAGRDDVGRGEVGRGEAAEAGSAASGGAPAPRAGAAAARAGTVVEPEASPGAEGRPSGD
jgi:two-component system sensor histidine kinase MtrB